MKGLQFLFFRLLRLLAPLLYWFRYFRNFLLVILLFSLFIIVRTSSFLLFFFINCGLGVCGWLTFCCCLNCLTFWRSDEDGTTPEHRWVFIVIDIVISLKEINLLFHWDCFRLLISLRFRQSSFFHKGPESGLMKIVNMAIHLAVTEISFHILERRKQNNFSLETWKDDKSDVREVFSKVVHEGACE